MAETTSAGYACTIAKDMSHVHRVLPVDSTHLRPCDLFSQGLVLANAEGRWAWCCSGRWCCCRWSSWGFSIWADFGVRRERQRGRHGQLVSQSATVQACETALTSMTIGFSDLDGQVRHAAFSFLKEQTAIHGDILPRKLLERGFAFGSELVPLICPQGIHIPRLLSLPLTFCTVPPNMRKPRPYEDGMGEDGIITYRYKGTDPDLRENRAMRKAMELKTPMIYLFGIVPGYYRPVWPVFIVGDSTSGLAFSVLADDAISSGLEATAEDAARLDGKRRYITRDVRQRLHQQLFREQVLLAYRDTCAICHLHHPELLDAAHILPDSHPQGDPVIPNGLALCKLHHAAFDENILGVSPDYQIDIREDILQEHDGPMLKFGLQEMQGRMLITPRVAEFKPSRDFLAIRYEAFKKAV